MNLDLAQVRTWLDVSGPGPVGEAVGYSIDSRTLRPGDLFVAIRGPRHDGHDFVPQALQRGAVAAIVESSFAGRSRGPLLPVRDTGEALRMLATRARADWGGTVIAVTGSGGKTTTKDAIGALLAEFQPVAKSQGNLNNEFGLPLSLLRVPRECRAAVLEVGINHPGEMAPLAAVAAPDIGLVTNVGLAHVGNFASQDELAREKGRLIEAIGPQGTAILNGDDQRVAGFRGLHTGRTVTFGIGADADVRGECVRDSGADGVRFRVSGQELASVLSGRHNVYNILAAVATLGVLGIGPESLAGPVSRLRPAPMRGAVRRCGGVTVIDDCYNANPCAAVAMLQVLRDTAAVRRIAVLGEMRELGERSRELHRQVGAALASAEVDYLVAVGGDAEEMVRVAGVPAEFHPSSATAASFLTEFVRAGDAVLIKASRGVGLEQVRDALLNALDRASGADVMEV